MILGGGDDDDDDDDDTIKGFPVIWRMWTWVDETREFSKNRGFLWWWCWLPRCLRNVLAPFLLSSLLLENVKASGAGRSAAAVDHIGCEESEDFV